MAKAEKSVFSVGSFTAMVAGLLMLVSALSYLFWPREFFEGAGFDYYREVLNRSGLYLFTHLTFMLSALFSICVVLTITELVQIVNRGLIRWIGVLGIVGFSVIAINFCFHPVAAINKSSAVLGQQGSYDGYGLFMLSDRSGKILVTTFPGSPAVKAGIQTGDVLVSVNGEPIRKGASERAVSDMLRNSGNTATITVRTEDQSPRQLTVQKGRVEFWDVSAQKAIADSRITELDPAYMFGFGLAGLWFLIVHWAALKKDILPKILSWLGMAAGIGFWLFISQYFIHWPVLTVIGKILGLSLGPLWFIWAGIVLRKMK